MGKRDENNFLYFDKDELDAEETDNKQVFVTKRIQGKEIHNIKKQVKSEPRHKEFKENNNEIVIDVPIKKESIKKENTTKKKEKNNKTKEKIDNKIKNKKRKDNKKINKKEGSKNSKKSSKNKNSKKDTNKKRVTKILVLIFIISACAVFAMVTPVFNISKIIVNGNKKLDEQTIVSLSEVKIGDNLFRNLKSKITENIKKNAYVENINIKRILPNTIEFDVEEREVSYQIQLINSYVYIDEQGYILENSNNIAEKIPLLEGCVTNENDLLNNKRLSNEDLIKLNTVLKIINVFTNAQMKDLIKKIDIADINDYTLYLENKTIKLGNGENLSNKVIYVQMILDDVKETSGTIFVNGDFKEGFRSYFRPE